MDGCSGSQYLHRLGNADKMRTVGANRAALNETAKKTLTAAVVYIAAQYVTTRDLPAGGSQREKGKRNIWGEALLIRSPIALDTWMTVKLAQ